MPTPPACRMRALPGAAHPLRPSAGSVDAPGPAPEVNLEPLARQSGRVTFGCLNNLAKISEEVLAVWSRVLTAVPGSRLLLRSGAGRSAEERDLAASSPPAASLRSGWNLPNRTATRFAYLELYRRRGHRSGSVSVQRRDDHL